MTRFAGLWALVGHAPNGRDWSVGRNTQVARYAALVVLDHLATAADALGGAQQSDEPVAGETQPRGAHAVDARHILAIEGKEPTASVVVPETRDQQDQVRACEQLCSHVRSGINVLWRESNPHAFLMPSDCPGRAIGTARNNRHGKEK